MAVNPPPRPVLKPGTYPPPPGMQWVRVRRVHYAVYIVLGILGIFTFGVAWLAMIVVGIADAFLGEKPVLRPIPVTYAAPIMLAPPPPHMMPPPPPTPMQRQLPPPDGPQHWT